MTTAQSLKPNATATGKTPRPRVPLRTDRAVETQHAQNATLNKWLDQFRAHDTDTCAACVGEGRAD